MFLLLFSKINYITLYNYIYKILIRCILLIIKLATCAKKENKVGKIQKEHEIGGRLGTKKGYGTCDQRN
jgi:hypothetical protein